MRSLNLVGAAAIGACLYMTLAPNGAKAADAPACEPQKLATKYPSLVGKTIKIGADAETQPWNYRDPADKNKIVGFDADLARAAFDCIGIPSEFVIAPFVGLFPAVAEGRADVFWENLYYTPERAKTMDFILYYAGATGVVVHKGNPKNVKTTMDMCGLRAGASLAGVEQAAFKDYSKACVAAGKKSIELVEYPDTAAGLRLIANDRADVVMTDVGMADRYIQESPDVLELGLKIETGFKAGIGVNKKEPELRQAIYDALSVLQAKGVEKELAAKYKADPKLEVPAEIRTE
jgi:polar amino acid transport system substrate-binding protein